MPTTGPAGQSGQPPKKKVHFRNDALFVQVRVYKPNPEEWTAFDVQSQPLRQKISETDGWRLISVDGAVQRVEPGANSVSRAIETERCANFVGHFCPNRMSVPEVEPLDEENGTAGADEWFRETMAIPFEIEPNDRAELFYGDFGPVEAGAPHQQQQQQQQNNSGGERLNFDNEQMHPKQHQPSSSSSNADDSGQQQHNDPLEQIYHQQQQQDIVNMAVNGFFEQSDCVEQSMINVTTCTGGALEIVERSPSPIERPRRRAAQNAMLIDNGLAADQHRQIGQPGGPGQPGNRAPRNRGRKITGDARRKNAIGLNVAHHPHHQHHYQQRPLFYPTPPNSFYPPPHPFPPRPPFPPPPPHHHQHYYFQ